MEKEAHIQAYHFSGASEWVTPKGEQKKVPGFTEYDLIIKLNSESEEISEQLEKEIQKRLPPFYKVVADIQFDTGSVIMTGTVVLLSWFGNVVFQAAREEVEQQLGAIIKVGVQRVFANIRKIYPAATLGPLNVNVVAEQRPKTVTPSQPSRDLAISQQAAYSQEPVSGLASPKTWSVYQFLLLCLLAGILVTLIWGNLYQQYTIIPRTQLPASGTSVSPAQ